MSKRSTVPVTMTAAWAVPMMAERASPKAKLLSWIRIAKSPPFGRFSEGPPYLLHPSADSLSVPLPECKVSCAGQLITHGEGVGFAGKWGLGCTLPESQQESGLSVGAGGPREHPDAKTIRARAPARGASRLDERRLGDGGRTGRSGPPGAAADRRRSAGGRGQRRSRPRALRTRRGRKARLPQRVSDEQGEDGGGRSRIRRAAGSRHA